MHRANVIRFVGLTISFVVFLPLVTGLILAIWSQGVAPKHGVLGYIVGSLSVWMYGVIFNLVLAVPIAVIFAAAFVFMYSAIGYSWPWYSILILGTLAGLGAALFRGLLPGPVCYPTPGNIQTPLDLSPIAYCSFSAAVLGALLTPFFFTLGPNNVVESDASENHSRAPHHER